MAVTKEDRKRNTELYKEGKRFCTDCKEVKKVSEFYNSNHIKHTKIPYRPICKQCSSIKLKEYYQRCKEWLLKRKQNNYEKYISKQKRISKKNTQ